MPITKKKPVAKSWEVKDRTYILTSNGTPVHYLLNTKHSRNKPLQYFDGEILRAIRYATNQSTVFVDEQQGDVIIGRVTFQDGKLTVPKEDVVLQQFLSIYHPSLNKEYKEFDPNKDAAADLGATFETLDAMNMVRDMDIEDLEAIARSVFKSQVSTMKSNEIRRDMLIFAQKNPEEFMTLANDENIKLRNLAIRAVEMNIIALDDNSRTFNWSGKKKEKLLTVPFGENPYSAMAQFFKTDEGLDALHGIQAKL
jgi:hypothetical protein